MASKKNVRNIAVYHAESARDTKQNIVVTLVGRSPKERKRPGNRYIEPQRIKASIPFDILPYIIRDMRKAWLEERARRMANIADIDSCTLAP